jgi:Rps23 Pro-64 3,4-dihydroxylase Tpa1-like proline 4-hydroxylase
MRRDIDAHFSEPEIHRPDTHQVWNYWFVPALYTYLRTDPEKIIQRSRVEAFQEVLREWAIVTLGMANVTSPYLSLYVSGCRQDWHNDSAGGRFAFVYSLTQDSRRTIGGETLVGHEGDLFRNHLARAAAGGDFYDAIEPKFNRLIVFDDRLPHAVERVDGSMDPTEGRIVLHGHLSEGGTIVEGALSAESARGPLQRLLQHLTNELSGDATLYHGLLVLQLTIDKDGAVAACGVLVDRVIHPDPGHIGWGPLRARVVIEFTRLRFPPADGQRIITQPVLFVGSLL